MFDIAPLPPGAPSLVRLLEKFARKLIRARYVAAYRNTRPLDEARLEAWRIPVAAQRLTDGIEEERDAVMSILQDAMAHTEGRS
jgi:hypothetical protein